MSEGARVQGEHPWQWVEGEWAMMRFEVAGDRAIELLENPDFGPTLLAVEGWDWEKSAYVEIAPGDLDRRFVDEEGQVLLKIFPPAEEEFFGTPVYLNSFYLAWDRES